MCNTIRLLIAEDHLVVRGGIMAILEDMKEIDVVAEAADGIEAVQKARITKPDVVLMDLMMPRKTGIEAIEEIRIESPNSRILVLTSYSDDDKVFAAIKAGAVGYLLKETSVNDLQQAIRDVNRGISSLHPALARKLIRELKRPITLPTTEEPLNEREADVLILISKGLSYQKIAAKLIISESTVRTYVFNILSKLHLANRTQTALYALKEGLASLDDDVESNVAIKTLENGQTTSLGLSDESLRSLLHNMTGLFASTLGLVILASNRTDHTSLLPLLKGNLDRIASEMAKLREALSPVDFQTGTEITPVDEFGIVAGDLLHRLGNAVGGAVVLAQEWLRQSDDSQSTDKLRVALEHLNSILSQFSRYYGASKIETTDLLAVLTDALQESGISHAIAVEVHIAPEAQMVRANHQLLTSAIRNLIANAVYAMSGAGKLSVVGFMGDEGFVNLRISDSGSGVPPDVLPHIFQPGFTTKGGQGQGLGLWLARAIVRRFGGELFLYETSPDRGTTFGIRLPGLPKEDTYLPTEEV